MNENPPSSGLPQPPSPPPEKFWPMFILGVLLIIGVSFFSWEWESIAPLVVGLIIALVSVFFRPYRGIFLGFIISIGVVLLGAVIFCEIQAFQHH